MVLLLAIPKTSKRDGVNERKSDKKCKLVAITVHGWQSTVYVFYLALPCPSFSVSISPFCAIKKSTLTLPNYHEPPLQAYCHPITFYTIVHNPAHRRNYESRGRVSCWDWGLGTGEPISPVGGRCSRLIYPVPGPVTFFFFGGGMGREVEGWSG